MQLAGAGTFLRVNPATGERTEFANGSELSLAGYEMTLLVGD
jgi:hypothetical protein